MINILKLDKNTFRINANNTNTEKLTLDQVYEVMNGLEINEDETDFAIMELTKKNHDVAHFGYGGTFIYTKEAIRE